MKYSQEFIDTVNKAAICNHQYLGTGNPNAKILIIGKELGFKRDTEEGEKQFQREITQNVQQWQMNINRQAYIDHNPHHPYKEMRLNSQSVGHTWRKYQLLHDFITGRNTDSADVYSFHQDFFLTELNQEPSEYSFLQNKDDRKRSISERARFIMNSKFFQSFPIVIAPFGNYLRSSVRMEITELFDVRWDGEIKELKKRQWYSLHYSAPSKKIVIHTRHLSMDVSNDLIKEIAEVVNRHKNETGLTI